MPPYLPTEVFSLVLDKRTSMMKDDQRQFHIDRVLKQGGGALDLCEAMGVEYDYDLQDSFDYLDTRHFNQGFLMVIEQIKSLPELAIEVCEELEGDEDDHVEAGWSFFGYWILQQEGYEESNAVMNIEDYRHWRNRRAFLVKLWAVWQTGIFETTWWFGKFNHIDDMPAGYCPKFVKDFLDMNGLAIRGGRVRGEDNKEVSQETLVELDKMNRRHLAYAERVFG